MMPQIPLCPYCEDTIVEDEEDYVVLKPHNTMAHADCYQRQLRQRAERSDPA